MPRSSNQKKTTTKQRTTNLRAGNRKCRRCKVVFYKEKGVVKAICPRCRAHCKRCDALLTEENYPKHLKPRQQFFCKPCVQEVRDISHEHTEWDRRDYMLTKTYGITSVEYEAILKAHGGGCWICGKQPRAEQRKLAVDHLHSKGESRRDPREKRGRIRGLLCWQCNSAIGKFGDDIYKLKRAAEYLEVWPAQFVLKEKPNG